MGFFGPRVTLMKLTTQESPCSSLNQTVSADRTQTLLEEATLAFPGPLLPSQESASLEGQMAGTRRFP